MQRHRRGEQPSLSLYATVEEDSEDAAVQPEGEEALLLVDLAALVDAAVLPGDSVGSVDAAVPQGVSVDAAVREGELADAVAAKCFS